MMDNREIIFVYGTLRTGGSNHHRMADAMPLGAGTVRGRLYRIDWYPGILLDDLGDAVCGEAFSVDAATLAELDAFEGAEYRRVRTVVSRDGAPPVEAWIWEFLMPVAELREIPGGDWLATEPGDCNPHKPAGWRT